MSDVPKEDEDRYKRDNENNNARDERSTAKLTEANTKRLSSVVVDRDRVVRSVYGLKRNLWGCNERNQERSDQDAIALVVLVRRF